MVVLMATILRKGKKELELSPNTSLTSKNKRKDTAVMVIVIICVRTIKRKKKDVRNAMLRLRDITPNTLQRKGYSILAVIIPHPKRKEVAVWL